MSDPIRNLAQFLALKKNADRKFVLMLGAGASISSGVKPTAEITGELVERFAAAEPGDVEARFDRLWSTATPETRESMLKPYLDQVPSRGYRPLAELIVKGFFDVVITFNFDRLLERALEDAGFHDYKVIVRGETDLAVINRLVEAKEPRVKILKMHGSLRSADYFLFSNEEMLNYPEEIRDVLSRLTGHDIIICGYAFNDLCVVKAFNDSEDAGSIYYVNPRGAGPNIRGFLVRRRSQDRVISGDAGRFDDFFEKLFQAVTTPVEATNGRVRQNLFKFLDHYQEEHKDWFVGRRRLTRTLVKRLDNDPPPVLFLHGKPKVGKTSFVRAGLIPYLDPARYECIYVRCKREVDPHLRAQLGTRLGKDFTGVEWPAILAELKASTPKRIVLLLDQFEKVAREWEGARENKAGDLRLPEELPRPGRQPPDGRLHRPRRHGVLEAADDARRPRYARDRAAVADAAGVDHHARGAQGRDDAAADVHRGHVQRLQADAGDRSPGRQAALHADPRPDDLLLPRQGLSPAVGGLRPPARPGAAGGARFHPRRMQHHRPRRRPAGARAPPDPEPAEADLRSGAGRQHAQDRRVHPRSLPGDQGRPLSGAAGMSIPATAPSLDLLDRLMAADEVWAHSAEEGRAVAEHILASQAAIVLLYGPARAASTAFMQRWVIPALSQWKRVSYVAAGEPISFDDGPDAGTGIRIFAGFEHHLAEGGSPTETMRRLAAATATSGTGKLVLVLQEDYLSRLFMAREVVPTILDDVFAIPTMPADKFVEALERTAATLGVTIDDSFVAALTRDLDAVRTRATLVPELVAILAFELYRSTGGASRPLTREDYDARDDLGGILAGHIDFLLEGLPAGASADIGWAVLQEVVRTGIGAPTDLVDVANRFDVAVDAPLAVAAWLEADRRVLRANNEGGHDVVPALLARGVEYHCRRMAEAIEHTHSQLRQAARQYLEFHALPPEPTFRRINAQRSALVVADDEARLMLRCALAYNGDNSDALHHWLRRVTSETAAVEILLDALFDSRADVRVRAARCLGRFNSQDVRDQLHLIALRDTVLAVRAAAVDSLQNIATPALRSALTRETLDPNSPYRLQAIEALRIFRDDRTVTTLVKIVDEVGPGHEEDARLRAIDVLGTHDTPQAVGALARIAVHDPDAADWEAAAKALGNAAASRSRRASRSTRSMPSGAPSRATAARRFRPRLIADGAAGRAGSGADDRNVVPQRPHPLRGRAPPHRHRVDGPRHGGTRIGLCRSADTAGPVAAHGPARIPDTAAGPARRALRRRAADAAAAGARHPAVRRRLRDGVRSGAWTLVGDGAKDQAGPGHHHVPGGGELPVLQLAPPRRGRPRRLQRRGAVSAGPPSQ